MLYCEPPPHPLSTTPTPEVRGGTHLSSSCQLQMVYLASYPLSTTEVRNPSFSSALSPLPNFSIPASNLGDKPEFPHKRERGQQNKRHSCLQNMSDFILKVTKRTSAQKCRLSEDLHGGSFPRIPQGAIHIPRSDSCKPHRFSEPAHLMALLLEPVVAAFPGGQ